MPTLSHRHTERDHWKNKHSDKNQNANQQTLTLTITSITYDHNQNSKSLQEVVGICIEQQKKREMARDEVSCRMFTSVYNKSCANTQTTTRSIEPHFIEEELEGASFPPVGLSPPVDEPERAPLALLKTG